MKQLLLVFIVAQTVLNEIGGERIIVIYFRFAMRSAFRRLVILIAN